MIATHNIKVNGKWIRPGEEYGNEVPSPRKKAETVAEQKPVAETAAPEAKEPARKAEPKQESKPKAPVKRKKVGE